MHRIRGWGSVSKAWVHQKQVSHQYGREQALQEGRCEENGEVGGKYFPELPGTEGTGFCRGKIGGRVLGSRAHLASVNQPKLKKVPSYTSYEVYMNNNDNRYMTDIIHTCGIYY